jgi:hypothetical protein
MLVALGLVTVVAPAAAQGASPPVSLERIRAELARTPAIDLSAVDPVVVEPALRFHVEVQGRYYRELPPVWEMPRGTATLPPPSMSGGSPALLQIDVLGLGRQLGSAVSKVRRARAGRAAHEEVEEALREYCAGRDCDPR